MPCFTLSNILITEEQESFNSPLCLAYYSFNLILSFTLQNDVCVQFVFQFICKRGKLSLCLLVSRQFSWTQTCMSDKQNKTWHTFQYQSTFWASGQLPESFAGLYMVQNDHSRDYLGMPAGPQSKVTLVHSPSIDQLGPDACFTSKSYPPRWQPQSLFHQMMSHP